MLKSIVAGFALILGAASAALAVESPLRSETERGTVRLIADAAAIAPGDTLTLGLRKEPAPGWHVYWSNPGDSGAKTVFDWTLPGALVPSAPLFPAPERVPFGPIVNYGYKDAVTLTSTVAVPADWPVGRPFPVSLTAEWLICADICVPEDGRFVLEVPTGPSTAADPATIGYFQAAAAAQPRPAPWPVRAQHGRGGPVLSVEAAGLDGGALADAYFFPDAWGQVNHSAPQTLRVTDTGLTLALPAADTPTPPETLSGVLTIVEDTATGPVRLSFAVSADLAGAPLSAAPAVGILATLGLALAGGLLLNLMPCVFPILAMKAVALARGAAHDRRARAMDGLAYSAGVVLSTAALGGAMLAARAGGAAVGWGFHLQDPWVVTGLAYVMVLVALNLSGVFEVGGRLMAAGSAGGARDGVSGSFLTGVLAVIVAAPCTAPFMATAMGAALTLPAAPAVGVFAMLGLGLALPFLLLCLSPALARALPKPGPWMATFKQVLAFPMLAAGAWLLWVLAQQSGPNAVFAALIGMILLAFGAWVWGQAQVRRGWGRPAVAAVAVLAAIGTTRWIEPADQGGATPTVEAPGSEPYSATRLDALVASGTPVFLNLTAAWCVTCQVNERLVFDGADFQAAIADNRFVYMVGDWTNRDPAITAVLDRYGRAGVPLYVAYPADGAAAVLPQVLTADMVFDALGTPAHLAQR